ncbi:hypothetical protein BN2537_5685 [Streptomyces venezuelae]|nr:hypothetical protein BN2537_5685 [Streptomyces venezuelae]
MIRPSRASGRPAPSGGAPDPFGPAGRGVRTALACGDPHAPRSAECPAPSGRRFLPRTPVHPHPSFPPSRRHPRDRPIRRQDVPRQEDARTGPDRRTEGATHRAG